jgi:hypothetical protein
MRADFGVMLVDRERDRFIYLERGVRLTDLLSVGVLTFVMLRLGFGVVGLLRLRFRPRVGVRLRLRLLLVRFCAARRLMTCELVSSTLDWTIEFFFGGVFDRLGVRERLLFPVFFRAVRRYRD